MKGKMILFSDDRGEPCFVTATVGKRKRTFHNREFGDKASMAKAAAAWMSKIGAKRSVIEERQMSPLQLVEEAFASNLIFHGIILALAVEAEGLERWDDFHVDLQFIASLGQVHVSYVVTILERIKAVFTPTVFCELAAAKDRLKVFSADPTFLTPLNDGLNRIKDAVCGNTRADRMMTIILGQTT